VIVLLGTALALLAGSHVDTATGATVNNFLNSHTLIQIATDASFFAIMAVGATIVIISAGIDLSVGSVYALAGVSMAMGLRALGPSSLSGGATVLLGLAISVAVGLLAGALNGAMWSAWACIRSSSRSGRCGSCAASPSSPAAPRAS